MKPHCLTFCKKLFVVYAGCRFLEDLLRDLTGGNSGQMPALLPL